MQQHGHVNESTMDICSSLCKDTWSNIIEFCDTREWKQLSYTCKGINQFKFNRLFMRNKRRTLIRTLGEIEIEHGFQLARGTLFNVHLKGNTKVLDGHFQFLESLCTSHRSSIKNLKGIHTLSMSFCKDITDNAFTNLVGIHSLYMRNCFRITDKAFPYLTGVHTLDMDGCSQITDQALQFLTGIHTLSMSNCSRITDHSFRHLVGIHELDIGSCKQVTDQAFHYLTGIHTLDIRYCSQITDSAFSHLGGIHTLNMTGCHQITDKAFVHISGIHTLNMTGCKNISDKAFARLTDLHALDLDGCDQQSISVKVLSNLKSLHKLTWFFNNRDKSFIAKVVAHCESNSIVLAGMKLRST